MNVTIKGKGQNLTLNKNDFVASGGEGSVYRKGNVAFKVYSDPKKMIPVDKITELGALTLPNIIRPQDILLDSRNKPIGYTMRYLKDTFALCQLFPKAFKERMGIKPADIVPLVKKFRELVFHCHSHGILIVDMNEYNFLVNDAFTDIYGIDCDSYQTKSFNAPVIMDSIRDRHATSPTGRYAASELTDWFSFGVTTFQLFIGIHPFKGKHPTIKSLDDRMMNNISVMNAEVGVPAICYPLSNIPQAYQDWYKAIFEQGKRVAPPQDMQAAVVLVKKVRIAGSNNFIIKKIQVFPDNIVRFDTHAKVTLTETGIYSDARLDHSYAKAPAVGVTNGGKVLAATVSGGKLKLFNVSRGQDIAVDMDAEYVMSYDGRLYFKAAGKFCQLEVAEAGVQTFVAAALRCQVADHSTKVLDGVVIQDALGACFASVFPTDKTCYTVHVKELDGLRIVDAKFDNRVLMALTYEAGKYNKYIFRFDKAIATYDVRTEKDIGTVGLNFVTLSTGVCLHMNSKDELELFSHDPKSSGMKTFDDPALSGDIKLMRDGTTAMFARGDELYTFEVKKP